MSITATTKPKMMSISAVIIRADGTRADLGEIAYYHKNPLRRLIWRVKKWLRS